MDTVGKPLMISRLFNISKKDIIKKNPYSVTSAGTVLKAFDKTEGKVVELSQTCADMNDLIPKLMGVSKSILKNVIFCHQEESLWPFGDSKMLKMIFDDIFETKKFSDLIDRMTDTRKKLKKEETEARGNLNFQREKFEQMIGSMNNMKNFLKDLKENMHKMTQEEKNRDEIEGKGISIDEVNFKIERAQRKIMFVDMNIEQKTRERSLIGIENLEDGEESEIIQKKNDEDKILVEKKRKNLGKLRRKLMNLKLKNRSWIKLRLLT